MVEVIFGEYKIQPGEQVLGYFSPDIMFKQKMSSGKVFVMCAEDVGIDKAKLEIIKTNTHPEVKIKIITNDKGLIKNLRSSKTFKVTKNVTEEPAMSPFDLAKAVITIADRQYIYDFLSNRKENLFMVIRVLTSSWSQLSERNRKCVMFLDRYFGKCSNDLLYMFMAFNMELQRSFWPKWNFPKSEEKTT